MGIALSKLWERLFSKGNYKIIIIGVCVCLCLAPLIILRSAASDLLLLMAGLDNAGKTTTLCECSAI